MPVAARVKVHRVSLRSFPTRVFWPSKPSTITYNERARRYADLASRLTFEHQSIFALDAQTGSFDLTVCRHVLHSIPQADAVIAELARVTRPGGYLHLIVEDYGMLHFARGELDPEDFGKRAARHGARY